MSHRGGARRQTQLSRRSSAPRPLMRSTQGPPRRPKKRRMPRRRFTCRVRSGNGVREQAKRAAGRALRQWRPERRKERLDRVAYGVADPLEAVVAGGRSCNRSGSRIATRGTRCEWTNIRFVPSCQSIATAVASAPVPAVVGMARMGGRADVGRRDQPAVRRGTSFAHKSDTSFAASSALPPPIRHDARNRPGSDRRARAPTPPQASARSLLRGARPR